MERQQTYKKITSLEDYSWTQPIQTYAYPKPNLHSFGMAKDTKQIKVFKKQFRSVSIRKLKFQQRKNQLQSFQHQNYLSVQFNQIKYQKSENQIFIKEFTLISPYIQSISLQNCIKQKIEFCRKEFIKIVQQIVNVMVLAERSQLFHYHLNSNSILLIKNNNEFSTEYLVKVCDWGFGNEVFTMNNYKKQVHYSIYIKNLSQTSMFQYLHPEFFFKVNGKEFHDKFKSKHDIWSFGVILYQLRYLKHPFSVQDVFSPQYLKRHYQKQEELLIEDDGLLASLIQRILSVKGFETWSEIKNFLINKAQFLQLDFLQMSQIYQNHIKLINYLIQVYKLIAWSISNSANCFWYQNKHIMKKALFHLLKLMCLLQKHKFLQRFGHRMQFLSIFQIKKYKLLTSLLQTQWTRVVSFEPKLVQSTDFFQNLQKLRQYLLPIQLRIDVYQSSQSNKQRSSFGIQIRQTWGSMKLLRDFSSDMLNSIKTIQNRNKLIFSTLYQMNLNKK